MHPMLWADEVLADAVSGVPHMAQLHACRHAAVIRPKVLVQFLELWLQALDLRRGSSAESAMRGGGSGSRPHGRARSRGLAQVYAPRVDPDRSGEVERWGR